MKVNINVDNRTIVRVLAVAILFLIGLDIIAAVSYPLTLVAISAFLALALNPPVSYLSSRITRGSRAGATGIAYLAVISVIVLMLWTIVPPLVSQSVDFFNNVPNYVDELTASDGIVADFVERYDLDEEISDFGSNLASQLSGSDGLIFTGINRVGLAIVSMLTILVLTFFMLIEGPVWLEKLWQAQAKSRREHRKELADKMYKVVTSYVNGQLIVATIAGASALIAMLVIQLDFALPLGAVVGLFSLIPLVGATLGAAVVTTVTLLDLGLAQAVGILAFFIIYQQIENNIIVPYIQSRTLDVSPLMVLVAVLFGISLGGILGGFVAIPVAACGRILLNDYYDHREGRVK